MKTVDSQVYYGCLVCISGREDEIIQRIHKNSDIRIISTHRLCYYIRKGQYSVRSSRVFPGYLFFSVNHRDFQVDTLEKTNGVIHLLKNDNGDWILSGEDAVIASEIFEHGGIIGFSKGRFVNGRLCIIEGFLKRYEDSIYSVDKRHRAAMIRLKLNNRFLNVWFSYDIDGDERQMAKSPLI